ncbi:MAG: c-type cytochrome [Vicingaceae bacterium]
MMMKNSLISIVVIALTLFTINTVKAQDGAKLFKNNCAACHKIEGTLVGPGLKGVKAKWADAGEVENLIKWVKNPAELYNSGKSEMAKIAWDITPIAMNAQNISDAEITAIFDFVDADVVVEKPKEESGATVIVEKPGRKPGEALTEYKMPEAEAKAFAKSNNNTRRLIFFALVITAIFLILGIVSISKTIQTFSVLKMKKKDDEKKSKGSSGSVATVFLALIMLAPFNGNAMSFDFEQDGWLMVSNADNIILFIVNLVLLFILFDQKKTLKTIINSYDPTLISKEKMLVGEEDTEDNVIKMLTGAVAIEDEASILLEHEYDGIMELDNDMPPWWVWSFVATIIFAFAYLIHFHVIGTGDLQAVEYQKTVDAAQVEVDAYMSKMAMNVDENNVELLTEAAELEKGKNLYLLNCVVCHKNNGEGLVGPNLTDDHWMYGKGDVKTVFTTIKYGTSNGMPEHESKMNPIELQQVSSYVLSMKYAEGKAPEGTKITK